MLKHSVVQSPTFDDDSSPPSSHAPESEAGSDRPASEQENARSDDGGTLDNCTRVLSLSARRTETVSAGKLTRTQVQARRLDITGRSHPSLTERSRWRKHVWRWADGNPSSGGKPNVMRRRTLVSNLC